LGKVSIKGLDATILQTAELQGEMWQREFKAEIESLTLVPTGGRKVVRIEKIEGESYLVFATKHGDNKREEYVFDAAAELDTLGIHNLRKAGYWEALDNRGRFRRPAFYNEVLRLKDKDDNGIWRFAMAYGPLWKCARHEDCFMNPSHFLGVNECRWRAAEKIQDYRTFSRFLNGLLLLHKNIAKTADISLRNSVCISLEGDVPFRRYFGLLRQYLDKGAEARDATVLLLYNFFLLTNPLRVVLGYDPDTSDFQVLFSPYIGYVRELIFMSLQAVLGQGKVAICDSCRQPYFRNIAPKRGQRNYCPDCAHGTRKK